jgi:hypothetical protein
MSWYSFMALWPDGTLGDAGSTRLSDDDQARRYAKLLVGEYKTRPGYGDPGLRMIVRNNVGEIVDEVPFLSEVV